MTERDHFGHSQNLPEDQSLVDGDICSVIAIAAGCESSPSGAHKPCKPWNCSKLVFEESTRKNGLHPSRKHLIFHA
ncbi:hypothetical protein N5A93_18500 [Roseovarius sp. EGI FJ00037]|uniref:hypothetical protein n=1 Tax=Roseovarius TaxID=74030 RepID=UPI0022A856AA|nr:hypothetical protein [Roseovarius sp. EGI FJ00037]MCZ0814214.1 hypothetical protein [Roseovarius sp. EGI FJ00037]